MGGYKVAGLLLVAAGSLGLYAATAGAIARDTPPFDPHQRGCERSGGQPQKCNDVSGATTTTRPTPPTTRPTPTTTPTPTSSPGNPPGGGGGAGGSSGGGTGANAGSSAVSDGGDSLVAQGLPPASSLGTGINSPVFDAPLRGPGGGGGVPLSMAIVIGVAGVATALLVAHGALGRRMRVSVPHEGDTLRFK